MQPANRLIAETQIVHVFVPLHSAVRFRLVVEFLDLQGCERRQLDVPDARHNMLVNVVLVICRRRCTDGWLRVVLIPELRPLANRVIPALRHINLFEFLHRFLELFPCIRAASARGRSLRLVSPSPGQRPPCSAPPSVRLSACGCCLPRLPVFSPSVFPFPFLVTQTTTTGKQ